MDVPPETIHCGCKINLFLRVGRKLPSGLHELESLFLPLSLPRDRLEIRRRKQREGLTVAFVPAPASSGPFRALSDISPADNTLTKAYAWYAEQTGFAPGLEILTRKGVPQGAGLGGGSADAAALLRFLQKRAKEDGVPPLPEEVLRAGAAAVGSDVPFFLLGGPALVSGVGERVSPAGNPFADHTLLLFCPGIAVSTAWAYAALDALREQAVSEVLLSGVTAEKERSAPGAPSPARDFANDFVNDFENPVFARFPLLRRLHGLLLRSGAELARLSGTGASVFAVYREEEYARAAAKTLASEEGKVYLQSLPA